MRGHGLARRRVSSRRSSLRDRIGGYTRLHIRGRTFLLLGFGSFASFFCPSAHRFGFVVLGLYRGDLRATHEPLDHEHGRSAKRDHFRGQLHVRRQDLVNHQDHGRIELLWIDKWLDPCRGDPVGEHLQDVAPLLGDLRDRHLTPRGLPSARAVLVAPVAARLPLGRVRIFLRVRSRAGRRRKLYPRRPGRSDRSIARRRARGRRRSDWCAMIRTGSARKRISACTFGNDIGRIVLLLLRLAIVRIFCARVRRFRGVRFIRLRPSGWELVFLVLGEPGQLRLRRGFRLDLFADARCFVTSVLSGLILARHTGQET